MEAFAFFLCPSPSLNQLSSAILPLSLAIHSLLAHLQVDGPRSMFTDPSMTPAGRVSETM